MSASGRGPRAAVGHRLPRLAQQISTGVQQRRSVTLNTAKTAFQRFVLAERPPLQPATGGRSSFSTAAAVSGDTR